MNGAGSERFCRLSCETSAKAVHLLLPVKLRPNIKKPRPMGRGFSIFLRIARIFIAPAMISLNPVEFSKLAEEM